MFTRLKIRYLLVAMSAFLFLQGSKDLSTTYVIDKSLYDGKETLPRLDGGAPRPIAVLAGPTGEFTEAVANEILFRPRDEKELDAFLARYGGKILRDGMPFVVEPLPKDHPPIESDGWYLIRIDPSLSELDDLEKNLALGPVPGEYRFSSEEAARFFAMYLREQQLVLDLNLLARPQAIPEHPDPAEPGGFLDAAKFIWMTEDDEPMLSGDQGLSTGVVHAWDYLRYHGLPPENGTYRPARIAILDGGFALSETGQGLPLDGNLDYGIGMMQADVIDHDGFAGGPNTMLCSGSPCPWHGQGAFGVAAAEPGNHFGGAGTGGRVVSPFLVRMGFDTWTMDDAIRTAAIAGSDVISVSVVKSCGVLNWRCNGIRPDSEFSRTERAIAFARSWGSVVVAAAGNKGIEISSADRDPMPCNITGVICVGAVNPEGMNVFNFGSAVDIWAPTNIRATVTPSTAAIDADSVGKDEVVNFSGTSAATPFIAGVAGLMKMLDPMISSQRVQDILEMTANHSTDLKVRTGWVDAFRAVQAVRPNLPPVVQWQSPAANAAIAWTGASLTVLASDPEVNPQNAAQWPLTVTFSSNVNGLLCSDSIPPYSCFSGPLALGNHVLTVTATDAFGATASATRNIQAINRPPVPDIALPLANGTYYAHQPVTVEAFILDPDEFIPQNGVVWTSSQNGVVGTGWSDDVMLSAGAHVITVVATDAKGATGQDSVTINVQPGTGLPTVRILQPNPNDPNDPNLGISPGTQITLRGAANDPEDGDLTGSSLVWSSDIDGILGTGQTINVVLSGPAVPCHPETVTHTIQLRATDSDGHTVVVTIRITVGTVC